jgi:hypothetical protein
VKTRFQAFCSFKCASCRYVAELIERGAALETRDAWRKAPVDWALQARQAEVVQVMRIEAVKRGVWGGRGKVAPLTTMTAGGGRGPTWRRILRRSLTRTS